MVRLDPQYHLVFGAGGDLAARRTSRGMRSGDRAAQPRRRAERSPLPRRQPRQARALPPVPGTPVPRLARPAAAGTCSSCCRCCGRGSRSTANWAATSATRASGWRSRSSRSTSACRRSTARACSRSCRSSSTSTASGTRSAAAARCREGDGPRRRASWASTFSLGEEVTEILFDGRRAVGVRTDAGEYRADARRDQRRLRPRDDAARARPPAPPLDRREDREEEVLLLDVHAVPRHRRPVRRPAAPHDLHGRATTRRTSRDIETAARAVRRPVVLRAERLRHRPDARPAGAQHALRPAAGHAPARRTSTGRRRSAAFRALAPASSWRRSASTTSSGASASRRS